MLISRLLPAAAFSLAALCSFPSPARADDAGAPSAATVTASPEGATTTATVKAKYAWGVAYFMSYDNNLESCGKVILDGIKKGVVSERTVAAVQADFTDAGGMHRYTIKKGGVEEVGVESDDSSNEDQAIAYLEWFVKKFPCERYAVTFLDHGGCIDEMCADEHPDTPGKTWMSGKVMGEKLRAFAKRLDGRLSLLFLQQCGRGSLENMYSFRGAAEYVMCSPVPVGAPNTYYPALHRWLGEAAAAKATGLDVAAKIAAEDQDYTIYTCLRGEKLADLPARLDRAIAPFLASATALTVPKPLPIIHPVGEPIVDAGRYLRGLSEANGGAGKAEVDAFMSWTEKELFAAAPWLPKQPATGGTRGRRSRGGAQRAPQLWGLSIYVPRTAREAAKYAYLDLLQETKLPELWKKLLAAAAKAKEPAQ